MVIYSYAENVDIEKNAATEEIFFCGGSFSIFIRLPARESRMPLHRQAYLSIHVSSLR